MIALVEQRSFAELITKIILVDDPNLPTYIVFLTFFYNNYVKEEKKECLTIIFKMLCNEVNEVKILNSKNFKKE